MRCVQPCMERVLAAAILVGVLAVSGCTDSSVQRGGPLGQPLPSCHLSPNPLPSLRQLTLARPKGSGPAVVPLSTANFGNTVHLRPGDRLALTLSPSTSGFQTPTTMPTGILLIKSVSGLPCGVLHATLLAAKPGSAGVFVTYRCRDSCPSWSVTVVVSRDA